MLFCTDVNECKQRPDICGPNASCENTMGNYTCQCDSGYIPTRNLQWVKNNTTCANVAKTLKTDCQTAVTLLNWILGTQDELVEKNLVELGNTVLQFTQKLLSTQVELPITQTNLTIQTEGMDAMTFSVGPNNTLSKEPQLWTNENAMDISLRAIASNNNGYAAVIFINYRNMKAVLRADLLHTENDTIKTMMSRVVSASLVKTNNKTLPGLVNFTLKHQNEVVPESQLTCVYWNENRWVVDGCEVSDSNANFTVCTCSHLSTFALIMQTDSPPQDDSLLELVSLVAVSVGLVFLALAILTFICCRWNPKVNNTTRLHLSICLFLGHLLFLLVQEFLSHIRPHKVLHPQHQPPGWSPV
ncbi:hypothetical protein SKAU_G00425810 [Synaphobranchus kaupii]|uniref:Uncharacterized protein n=1 Tax=Synaphobranchus kaupii TaxID=118154 RepID=A0A9Q1E546_SYNKA|nr:hypothetical protein SKAU_G00425810 [Synaphobranchus kaupii]